MKQFSERKLTIAAIIIFVALIFIIRLFYIQVIDDKYKLSAENNSQQHIKQYPARGLIYDRNGELLVYNQATYDLMIIPRQVKKIDTIDFCNILNIEKSYFEKRLKKCKKYSRYKASTFMSQLTYKTYAVLQEKLHSFPGFFVQTRTLRKYPLNTSAHILGYIGEVNNREIGDYYKSGDYIGKSGIELTYEKYLRGKKGLKIYLVDVHNRKKGSYENGKYDVTPEIGNDITTTIDINLQMYAEKLMQNKKGGIVAIDPKTGEILTKLSAPAYNPELFIGNGRGQNYSKLKKDTLNPLFDRAMMAMYPPGSIFKLVQALIGLEEEAITTKTEFECHDGFRIGRFKMGCHHHHSPIGLEESIQQSCNSYYANTFKNILESKKYELPRDAYKKWREYVCSFGFGDVLGVDIPYEKKGLIPTAEFWDKRYKRKNWKALNIISLAIGQGELLITPLQMANMVCSIANRGYYITPHIVKDVKNEKLDSIYLTKKKIDIKKEYFEHVINGMEMVISGGKGSTGRLARVDSINVCGKTGTVQNPHGDDHSVFVAFAPKENPKIALVVYVENGVWGSRYGAPIAGLLIEKYLKGSISKEKKWLEKKMLDANLIENSSSNAKKK